MVGWTDRHLLMRHYYQDADILRRVYCLSRRKTASTVPVKKERSGRLVCRDVGLACHPPSACRSVRGTVESVSPVIYHRKTLLPVMNT